MKSKNNGTWNWRQVRCAQDYKRTTKWTYTIKLNQARGLPDSRENCTCFPECKQYLMRPCQTGMNSQTVVWYNKPYYDIAWPLAGALDGDGTAIYCTVQMASRMLSASVHLPYNSYRTPYNTVMVRSLRVGPKGLLNFFGNTLYIGTCTTFGCGWDAQDNKWTFTCSQYHTILLKYTLSDKVYTSAWLMAGHRCQTDVASSLLDEIIRHIMLYIVIMMSYGR